ncbi:MAG: HD domain-containing protein [Bacteroidaceae bacterium]|nr:HD domain-containing protein [Bacteroidaceae bacterium]
MEEVNYDKIVQEAADEVFRIMARRVSEEDLKRVKQAFELAKEAHSNQRRKSGEPYIIHPIAVACIIAKEMKMGANPVIAAFLHDVVEDTDYTVEDIEERFGEDVAFLVDTVTKKKQDKYKLSKQMDNYKQLLDSLNYDIRALMVKIADRLHNMRTLSSMRLDKQMKIAGETDYFYAPLANRLGLFDVKTELENLSFKFRCPGQYPAIEEDIRKDKEENGPRLSAFTSEIMEMLREEGIPARAEIYYRAPYSLYRRMLAGNCDYQHLDNRYYVRITFSQAVDGMTEKQTCLRIYSLLTDRYKEKPGSFVNQIDLAKENAYRCIRVMLLSGTGVWEDVQISSQKMVESSRLGCLADRTESNVSDWIVRFKKVLQDIAMQSMDGNFIESVKTTLYYDDIMVFSPRGLSITLPKGATAIDYAFELGNKIGLHAKYARINGKLSPVKTVLNQGDCVEIGIDVNSHPKPDWLEIAQTYKAKHALRKLKLQELNSGIQRCPHCRPLPGGETIGYRDEVGILHVHRRSCPEVIRLASKHGDSIEPMVLPVDPKKGYPVSLRIRAVDRYHLLIDIIDHITNKLHLTIDSLDTKTADEIVDCNITFFVTCVDDLLSTTAELYKIEGVDEIQQTM